MKLPRDVSGRELVKMLVGTGIISKFIRWAATSFFKQKIHPIIALPFRIITSYALAR
jgi:hypothetical protein